MKNIKQNRSCADCIWCDQCENDKPCDMFDSGKSPVDEEIDIRIESGREEYYEEYSAYIRDYNDVNWD